MNKCTYKCIGTLHAVAPSRVCVCVRVRACGLHAQVAFQESHRNLYEHKSHYFGRYFRQCENLLYTHVPPLPSPTPAITQTH